MLEHGLSPAVLCLLSLDVEWCDFLWTDWMESTCPSNQRISKAEPQADLNSVAPGGSVQFMVPFSGTIQVVFSFGGINVLPALLVDFHSRGGLARALVSFTWRSYLFIIFFYVPWLR